MKRSCKKQKDVFKFSAEGHSFPSIGGKNEEKYWSERRKKPQIIDNLPARDVAEIVDQCNKIGM